MRWNVGGGFLFQLLITAAGKMALDADDFQDGFGMFYCCQMQGG
jgi:hypothetical protein